MNLSRFLTRAWCMRLLACAVAGSALYWCIGTVRATVRAESFAAVDLSGVHHLGDKFNVADFYVNGFGGGNVGREGGGGGVTCCVMLPRTWRPGLSVEVRWTINDWSHEKPAEVEAGNYDSVAAGGAFIALVPVERYEKAAHVWVHFYAGGKARVLSSPIGNEGSRHPIQDNDPHAIDGATAGRRVDALFSPEELAEMKRKNAERKKTFGDWR